MSIKENLFEVNQEVDHKYSSMKMGKISCSFKQGKKFYNITYTHDSVFQCYYTLV
uniref:Uncharacterized protein n=1 Tax=Rhizophora mucronata TaxID=61149 RepID=A0A2P2NZY0_RHIMU